MSEIIRDVLVASTGLSASVLPPIHIGAAPVEAHFQYLYDPVGNVTQFTNPNSVVYQYFFNERDQIYRELRAVGAAEEQETRFEFDANDNQILRLEKNAVSGAGPWVEEHWGFDLQDRLIRHKLEISNGGGTPLFAERRHGLDGSGNLAKLVKPEGNEVTWSYNARNKTILMRRGAAASPESARVEYFFDFDGNPVLTVQHTEEVPDVFLKSFTIFDGYNRMAGSVDPIGTRRILSLDPVGNVLVDELQGYGGGPSPVDNTGIYPALSRKFTDYDEADRPFRVKHDLLNHANHATGDANGQIVQQSAYDRLGRRTYSIEHPVDGDTSKKYRTEYDGRGRVVKQTDPAGNFSTHIYDQNDNLIETTETDLATIAGVSEETFTTTLYYDALDREIQVGDNLGNTRRYEYDGQNNVILFSDANGPLPETLPRRDPNLQVYVANLHGNVTHFTYDGMSRLKEKRLRMTASGKGDGTTSPPVDATQSGDGYITIATLWDKNSRVAQQIDDNGNVTQYLYDELDRKQTAIYASGTSAQSVESWTYDGADRVIGTTDQNGTQIGNTYDLASRLINKQLLVAGSGTTLVGTLSQSFEWDGLGRLTKGIDENGGASAVSCTRSYDSLSRNYFETQSYGPSSYAVESFWKGEALRWNLVYPNGRSILSTFDNMNRLDTLDGGIVYDYVGKSRILERAFPNDTKLSYLTGLDDTGYDGVRRILRQKSVRISTGESLVEFKYAYNREHRRKSVRRFHDLTPAGKTKGELYDYDSANRLVDWKEGTIAKSGTATIPVRGGGFAVSGFIGSATLTVQVLQPGGYPTGSFGLELQGSPTDSQSWTLDGVGNWVQMKRLGQATNTAVSEHNAYLSWGATTQVYDGNGNLTDDGSYFYYYDFLNRLRGIVDKVTLATVAAYEYDAMNRRVIKTSGGTTTRYLYDGWHAIEERVGETVTKQFVFGQETDEILKQDQYSGGSIAATHYYQTDALGSVAALTDSAGAVVERVKYSPYGQPYWMDAANAFLLDGGGNYVNASTVGNPLLFTAARYDAETALRTASKVTDAVGNFYLRNRYLDSDKGRFTTRDPIGIWGDEGNLGGGYVYCANDPVNCKDPSGLKKKCKEDEEEEKLRKRAKDKLRQLGLDPDDPRFANQLANPDFVRALEVLIDNGTRRIEIVVDQSVPGASGRWEGRVFRITIGEIGILEGAIILADQFRSEHGSPANWELDQFVQDAAGQIILHEIVETSYLFQGYSANSAHVEAANAENRWATRMGWDWLYIPDISGPAPTGMLIPKSSFVK